MKASVHEFGIYSVQHTIGKPTFKTGFYDALKKAYEDLDPEQPEFSVYHRKDIWCTRRPDLWCIDLHTPRPGLHTFSLYEIEDKNRMSWVKLQEYINLWWYLDGTQHLDMRLFAVDRYGIEIKEIDLVLLASFDAKRAAYEMVS